jgi:hypothetical protein
MMIGRLALLHAAFAALLLVPAVGLNARAGDAASAPELTDEFASLADADAALKAARSALDDCEKGCITPSEATIMALSGGEGEARPGRFLLEIRGGGQSFQGQLGTMMFVNSRPDYATLGTLTIAFEPEALNAFLRRARGCGAADVVDGQITVKACHGDGVRNLNMFTMMQRLCGRRIIVEGEVRRQWIDFALGTPKPVANLRGEHEPGYYQVWVHVTDAAQVTFAEAEWDSGMERCRLEGSNP